MPQQIYPITDEEKAIGVVFKELFTSPDTCSKNGTVLVGSPAVNRGITLNGTTQYATNSKRLSLNGQGFVVLRFTPSFAYNINALRAIFGSGTLAAANGFHLYKHDNANLNRLMCYLGTGYVFCNGADYSAYWLVNEENVLVVSLNGTSSAMWLNGNALTVIDAGMSNNNITSLGIGASSTAGGSLFSGSIQSLIIGNRPLTQGCEERLITPEPLSRIRTENSLVTIPGVQAYDRTDGKRVTPLLGKIATQHGVTEAVLGDGVTATTFPTLITPRGFSFDGGDYLNLGDNDALSFGNGLTDSPFSVVVQMNLSVITSVSVVSKGSIGANGEYGAYRSAGRIYFLVIDNSIANCYLGRYFTLSGADMGTHVYAFVYDGRGSTNLDASCKIYRDGVRIDSANGGNNQASYVAMENLGSDVTFGRYGASYLTGSLILPEIYDVELSECEVRALTARVQRQTRTR